VKAAGAGRFEPRRSRHVFYTYWKIVYSIAVKAGLPDNGAQDVVQETLVSVAKGLREGRFRDAGG